MIDNLIVIIPTHNRQHYLNRVAWYYSQFNMQVYICDSTPAKACDVDYYDNIHYIWCPDKTFNNKILYVLNCTEADFYAMSPDDDFLRYETLIECYNAMQYNNTYSLGVGRQVYFRENSKLTEFKSNIFMNRLMGRTLSGSKITNTMKFWVNYQNILWSIFRKDVLVYAFSTLIKQEYKSQNFIEVTLGMAALNHGNIYITGNALNYREVTDSSHWGREESVISIENYFKFSSMKYDIYKFWALKEGRIVNRIGLCSYLLSTTRLICFLRYFIDSKICRKSMDDIPYIDKLMIKKITLAQTYVKH